MSSLSFTSLVAPVAGLQAEYLYTAQRVAEENGLTAARWQVLSAAAEPSSVADIARGLGLARQSVQRVADDLADAGLAAWSPNPRHARAKLLSPTAKGAHLLDVAAQAQLGWAADVGRRLDAAGVSQDAVDAAVAVLDRVIEASQEHWDQRDEADQSTYTVA